MIKVANKTISQNSPPFIIAEMSGNHNQSLDRALEIVEAASVSGVHGFKLQTYTADTMTLNVKKDEFEEVKNLVEHEMEKAIELKVALDVDVNSGHTWYEAK